MNTQLRCEVCGRKIFGKPFKVIIEGAKLTVCTDCSKHGKIMYGEDPIPQTAIPKAKVPLSPSRFQIRKTSAPSVDTTQELVHDYTPLIRQAREKLGLSHEDLGKKINERVSLLKKIETGKMTPNNTLAVKLEHTLKIRLIVPAKEEKVPEAKIPKKPSREFTLGDLIKINSEGKEKEDKTGRKQS